MYKRFAERMIPAMKEVLRQNPELLTRLELSLDDIVDKVQHVPAFWHQQAHSTHCRETLSPKDMQYLGSGPGENAEQLNALFGRLLLQHMNAGRYKDTLTVFTFGFNELAQANLPQQLVMQLTRALKRLVEMLASLNDVVKKVEQLVGVQVQDPGMLVSIIHPQLVEAAHEQEAMRTRKLSLEEQLIEVTVSIELLSNIKTNPTMLTQMGLVMPRHCKVLEKEVAQLDKLKKRRARILKGLLKSGTAPTVTVDNVTDPVHLEKLTTALLLRLSGKLDAALTYYYQVVSERERVPVRGKVGASRHRRKVQSAKKALENVVLEYNKCNAYLHRHQSVKLLSLADVLKTDNLMATLADLTSTQTAGSAAPTPLATGTAAIAAPQGVPAGPAPLAADTAALPGHAVHALPVAVPAAPAPLAAAAAPHGAAPAAPVSLGLGAGTAATGVASGLAMAGPPLTPAAIAERLPHDLRVELRNAYHLKERENEQIQRLIWSVYNFVDTHRRGIDKNIANLNSLQLRISEHTEQEQTGPSQETACNLMHPAGPWTCAMVRSCAALQLQTMAEHCTSIAAMLDQFGPSEWNGIKLDLADRIPPKLLDLLQSMRTPLSTHTSSLSEKLCLYAGVEFCAFPCQCDVEAAPMDMSHGGATVSEPTHFGESDDLVEEPVSEAESAGASPPSSCSSSCSSSPPSSRSPSADSSRADSPVQ